MKRSLKIQTLLSCCMGVAFGVSAHVPHDIIYSLDASPDFAESGMILASSTQFGEGHLVSHNFGETFAESHRGMRSRSLVTGHTYSPNFKHDGTVYMVTQQGYFKSTDRGENWVLQKRFRDAVVLDVCLAPDYTATKDIYLLSASGVYLAGHDGETLKTLLPKDEITFGKSMIANGKLYVHSVYYKKQKMVKGMEHIDYLTGAVDVMDLKSGDWSTLDPKFDSAVVADMDISGSSMLVALKDGSVLLKDEGSNAWKEVFKRDRDYVAKLRFSPNYEEDRTMVAGTAWGFVFMSENGGKDWELRSNGLSRWVHHFDILVKSIQFSPNYKNDHTILMGKTTGFYKTTDKGRYWRHINVWNTKWGYYVLPAPGKDATDLFTATYNSGISRSTDMGGSWESANLGITAAFANGMVLSPNYENDHSIFVVDIATGPYRSSDGGRTWGRIPELDPKRIYDKPSLFRELGISPRFKDDGVMLIFLVPRHVLGVEDSKMVFRFNDKTKEVKRVYVEKGNCYVNSFAFSPAASKQDRMYCASSSGVSVSTDKGQTWKNIFNDVGIQQIFISPNVDKDGLIYLMDKDGQIHRSTDNGTSFVQTGMNLNGQYVNNLTFSPDYARDNTIYVTTFGEGVLRSSDDGTSWSYFGLKGKFLYTGLSFSANYSSDKTIFAPAVDGIYRSTDDGKNWKNCMGQTQLLAKDVFFTMRDSKGKDIPLMRNAVGLMKQYEMFDQEAFDAIYKMNPTLYEKVMDPRAYLCTYYRLNEADYGFEVDFYGNAIEYKCVTGPDMGIANIILDGENVGTFDFYSAQKRFDVDAYQNGSLAMGYHRLRIEMTGGKNPASGGPAITFNAANIIN